MFYSPYYQAPMPDQLQQYRQAAYVPQMQPTQQPVATQDERIWVTGRNGADSYLVAPNGFVRLWDNTANRFYEKRADATGRPVMEAYTYSKDDNMPSQTNSAAAEYDGRINELESRIKALEAKYEHNANDSTVQ